MLEGLPLSIIALAVSSLGAPGLVFVFWYVDQRRIDRILAKNKEEHADAMAELREERKAHDRQLRDVLDAYREDVRKVSRFYEDNVLLVKGYERHTNDLAAIVHLNTQAMTHLVEKLQGGYCPLKKGEG